MQRHNITTSSILSFCVSGPRTAHAERGASESGWGLLKVARGHSAGGLFIL